MPKTVTANEAKNRLGALMGYVSSEDEQVIVERHGKPTVAIVSLSALEELQELREKKRREDALERLRQLEERIAAANQGRTETEEEVIEWADKLSHEIIDNMAERGEIVFERDLRRHT